MGKTRDSSRTLEIRKKQFREKMGTIKDRSDMDLTEAEDIKKRWQEYTEGLYKLFCKELILMTQITTMV